MERQRRPAWVMDYGIVYLVQRVWIEPDVKIQMATILKRKMVSNIQGGVVQGAPILYSLSRALIDGNPFVTSTLGTSNTSAAGINLMLAFPVHPDISVTLKYPLLPELSSHLPPSLL